MSNALLTATALLDTLQQRVRSLTITKSLIVCNLLVFFAMLVNGAGFWHSPNGIQLAWGANFGPATQDGQWWRLGSAMFLHFGAVHLTLNLWALWDGGQFVERMYGHARFLAIYVISGLIGNLLSLVVQGSHAVSGGASGAIFGIYGALLTFLWRERYHLHPSEFRWLFFAALGFTIVCITFGFVIPGIDNSAHIGGFIIGVFSSVVLAVPLDPTEKPPRNRGLVGVAILVIIVILVAYLPKPAYRWSQEVQAQKEISEFLQEEAAINQSWLAIVSQSKQNNASFEELAGKIDTQIHDRYEESFEQLSKLPVNSAMPSATTIAKLLEYSQQKRDASRELTARLRFQGAINAVNRNRVNAPENSDKGTVQP